MNGIDFFFALSIKGRRIEIPLQVKSSWAGILHHKSYGSNIYAVNGQSPRLREHIEAIIDDYNSQFGGGKVVNTVTPVETVGIEEERKLELVPAVSQNAINPSDVLFEIRDGKVWVSSLEIARLFERRHDNVMQAIKNLEVDDNFAALNFQGGSYRDANNQERPMFTMTKKGYRRLVMDFTGKRASEVKEQLLDRFEELEEKENRPAIPALSGDFGALLIQAGQQIQEQNLQFVGFDHNVAGWLVLCNDVCISSNKKGR